MLTPSSPWPPQRLLGVILASVQKKRQNFKAWLSLSFLLVFKLLIVHTTYSKYKLDINLELLKSCCYRQSFSQVSQRSLSIFLSGFHYPDPKYTKQALINEIYNIKN